MTDGMLINGALVTVPGVPILPPDSLPWIKLYKGNARTRCQQALIHKTIADDPERVDEQPGPATDFGGIKPTLEEWFKSQRSGTQLIAGYDGTVVCTEDLVRFESYHGHEANALSFGIEMKEHYLGSVHRITLANSVKVVLAACSAIGIQWQCPTKYINNKPNARFNYHDGGADMIGIFGHRDATEHRGYWDPGDEVFAMFRSAGCESFDFYAKQDLDVWARRQEWLASEGYYKGAIDGIAGAKTTAALKELGYPDGIFARQHELAEKPPMPG
jgi:hypothetical protein